MTTLFQPVQIGRMTLKNRVVMAPMTRSRAHLEGVPTPIMAEYYGQRAGAGLIITEGTTPSPNGLGYARIPGIYSPAQVKGWRAVTEAVHAQGSHLFVQLMHTGRVCHPLNMPAGARVLAPSAVAAPGSMYTDQSGMMPHPEPEAMSLQDIQHTIQEFAHASALAIEAGFDGVELHAANGYLLDQFLNPASNHRTDAYGGSEEGRMRFVLEVAEACAARIGADRVGIRLSPYGVFNGMAPFDGTDSFYAELAGKLSALGLLYIHIVDHSSMGAPAVSAEVKAGIRARFSGTVILSGGYTVERAEADLAAGKGELVAWGRPFISNPTLVEKLQSGAELAPPDFSTFYTPGPKGYTDYV